MGLDKMAEQAVHQTTRRALRQMTTKQHEALEAHWSPSGGFASKTQYLSFLSRALHVHHSLGVPAAKALGDDQAHQIEMDRLKCLSADLGCPVPETFAGDAMNPGYAWGIAYVLNGSCLGAAVMFKRGDILADWPSRYMRAGQTFAQSGQLRDFFSALENADIDIATASRGAEACFAAFAKETAEEKLARRQGRTARITAWPTD